MSGTRSGVGALMTVVLAAGLMACGASGQHVAPVQNIDERLAVTGSGDFAAMQAEAEQHWAARLDRAEVEAAIGLWEAMLHVETPGDRYRDLYPVLVSLSRAQFFLADTHMRFDGQPDMEGRQKAAYQVGIEWGRLALSVNNAEWNRALLYERPIPDAVSVTTREDVPAMYWYSTNMGRWALLDGTPTVLAHKDDIAAVMGRIAELDRNFFYGASDRYFGVYYTRIPVGNPDLARARQHFEAAIQIEPNYLAARVLFAAEYATKAQDRALFEELLNYVVAADVNALPDVTPENTFEQRKAQELLANIDELFR